MPQRITNFRAKHSRCCASVGPSTPLAAATSPPPSRLAPFHSVSNLLAISMTLVAPYSGSSLIAHKSSSMARICSTTSAPLAIVLRFMAISSILFDFGTVTQLHTFGNHRHPLWLSSQVFVAIVIPDHDGKCVKLFYNALKSAGWCLTSTDTSFPTHGDTISGLCRILIGIHTSCAPTVEPLAAAPQLVPLGAVQSDGACCLAGNGRRRLHASGCQIHGNVTPFNIP